MSAPLEMLKKGASDPSPEDIDRFGDLDLKVQLFAPTAEEHELLKKKIEAAVATKPGDLPAQVQGHRYELQLSARRNKRTITNVTKVFSLLRKRLGLAGLLSLITIPFGEAVDKHMTDAEKAGLIVEERTGSRSVKVVAKRPAA